MMEIGLFRKELHEIDMIKSGEFDPNLLVKINPAVSALE